MVRQCQYQDTVDVARTILQKKLGIHEFLIKKMQYLLQRHCISCGVFVYYFAEQIVKCKKLLLVFANLFQANFSPSAMFIYIFKLGNTCCIISNI